MLNPILDKFRHVAVWKNKNKRAPHKPLLLLWALGKVQNGDYGPWSFAEVEKDLIPMLRDYAPSTRVVHPEYPFIRLRNDGIWRIIGFEPISNTDPSASKLRNTNAQGSFTHEIELALQRNSNLVSEIISFLLQEHFTETYHDDIATACCIGTYTVVRLARDSNFRSRILSAYGNQCALCGYNIIFQDKLVGLEAAHIKWHKAGGSDFEDNGIALCGIHHNLFDRGCFHIDKQLSVRVSPYVNGHSAVEHLLRFDGKSIADIPTRSSFLPNNDSLSWHLNEVYKKYGN